MTYNYTFTVFTPIYNRAHTLSRVYESLKVQTFQDFEWLIVNDGSQDESGAMVKRWQREARFPIRYIWQENTGKPIAVNRGVQQAQGELFLTLDSDDACLPIALERLKFHWDSIPADQKTDFSAVTCLTQDPDGGIVGDRFPFDPIDSNSLEIRLKYRVAGEKWGFQRTDVLKQFPNPQIAEETYITESIVWNRIALRYKTRYVNEPLRIYFRSSAGLGTTLARVRNCQSARFYYQEFVNLDYPIPRVSLLKGYANYVRYSWHAKVSPNGQVRDIPSVAYWITALPVGSLLYLKDRMPSAS